MARHDQIVAVIQISDSQSLIQELIMKNVHIDPTVFCEDICMFLQSAYIKRSVLPLAENE
ncbi:hypothetical protein I79_005770 [Cricetulus griseus]|uniref:Uncharacterized protein n=1 Tax=Cricetulus griseus TaxID=10029 RepID=G3H617_CRIGR|nr:hypothetical protein I79_005770 [Cricetulus griseus]